MPLFQEWSPNAHSLAGIWHIEEDESFFNQVASVRVAVNAEHITHPRRRLEHLAGRYLLQHLKEDFPLHHISPDIHDKPRLPENQYFFSISHSHPYVAVVISDKEECGIDIQCWHKSIESIAHMFLSDAERALCNEDARLLTLCWSIKEAAYKWYGRRGTDFIRDLPINQIINENILPIEKFESEYFNVQMQCFGLKISPEALLYKDFSLSTLIRERKIN